MNDPVSNAHFIVTVIGYLAWPITVLLLGLMFRGGLTAAILKILPSGTMKELSAGSAGITAKFETDRQEAAESEHGARGRSVLLPPGMNFDDIRERHESGKTKYSERLFRNVREHIEALNVSGEDKVELLCREVAQLQAAVQWLDLAKPLFRSQFDLLGQLRDRNSRLQVNEANQFFQALANRLPSVYEGWDYIKYLAYPASVGLIEYKDGGYQLTEFGESFVDFMRSSPRLIDGLTRL